MSVERQSETETDSADMSLHETVNAFSSEPAGADSEIAEVWIRVSSAINI